MTIYTNLQIAFDRFNDELFGDVLGDKISDCVITLQRKSNTCSYLTFNSFLSLDKSENKLHEICLNPEYFGVRPRIELLQSLAHEMTHVYQHMYGTVSKEGTHDEQFLDYMNAIGLMPSSNGLLDGKTTGGKKMFNYPMPDGRFLEVCNSLCKDNLLPSWFELAMPNKVSIDSIVAGLYHTQDLLGGLVEPELLEVPILINKNIDVQSLLSCLTVNESTNKVDLDRSKASDLAEKAIKEDKQEPKLSSTFDSANDKPNYQETYKAPAPKPVNHEDVNDGSQSDNEQSNDEEQDIDSDDDSNIINDNYQVVDSAHHLDSSLDEDDAAARFLKQAMDNKPEKFERPDYSEKSSTPHIVQSTDEIASILGLESAAEKKATEKKKVRYKYTCSCEKVIWGGLGLSVICGNCQLHFMCETIEKETGVVQD